MDQKNPRNIQLLWNELCEDLTLRQFKRTMHLSRLRDKAEMAKRVSSNKTVHQLADQIIARLTQVETAR